MDDAIGLFVVLCAVAFWALLIVGAVVLAGAVLVVWVLLLVSAWIYRRLGGKDWR